MTLPKITHLQFKVLSALIGADRSGLSIREQLKESGVRQTSPAFYQMMSRLEEADLVEGWYVRKSVEGQLVKTRCYRLTETGLGAWKTTRDFYLETVQSAKYVEGLAESP